MSSFTYLASSCESSCATPFTCCSYFRFDSAISTWLRNANKADEACDYLLLITQHSHAQVGCVGLAANPPLFPNGIKSENHQNETWVETHKGEKTFSAVNPALCCSWPNWSEETFKRQVNASPGGVAFALHHSVTNVEPTSATWSSEILTKGGNNFKLTLLLITFGKDKQQQRGHFLLSSTRWPQCTVDVIQDQSSRQLWGQPLGAKAELLKRQSSNMISLFALHWQLAVH